MSRRFMLRLVPLALVTLVLGAAMLTARPAFAQSEAPEAFVKRAFNDDWAAFRANRSLFTDKKVTSLYFEPGLTKQLLSEGLEADPILNAQDAVDVRDLTVAPATITGTRARLDVTWKNSADTFRAVWTLIRTKDGWRIWNIEHTMRTELEYLFELHLKN